MTFSRLLHFPKLKWLNNFPFKFSSIPLRQPSLSKGVSPLVKICERGKIFFCTANLIYQPSLPLSISIFGTDLPPLEVFFSVLAKVLCRVEVWNYGIRCLNHSSAVLWGQLTRTFCFRLDCLIDWTSKSETLADWLIETEKNQLVQMRQTLFFFKWLFRSSNVFRSNLGQISSWW